MSYDDNGVSNAPPTKLLLTVPTLEFTSKEQQAQYADAGQQPTRDQMGKFKLAWVHEAESHLYVEEIAKHGVKVRNVAREQSEATDRDRVMSAFLAHLGAGQAAIDTQRRVDAQAREKDQREKLERRLERQRRGLVW